MSTGIAVGLHVPAFIDFVLHVIVLIADVFVSLVETARLVVVFVDGVERAHRFLFVFVVLASWHDSPP
jgi:hypothetical protein